MKLIVKRIFEDEKLLLKIVLGGSAIWVVAQIVLIVYFWGHPQFTDMGAYISIALRCFASKEWYPMAEDIYSIYIWAPGFINYLILQLHIFGTINFNAVLNLFLNIAMLFEIYYLGKKFFSKRTGLLAAIIFMLLYSNLIIVIGACTEIPFLFLCLSALCLVFSGKYKYIVLGAVLFAFANWIRPLVIIFLFASIVYLIVTKTKFYNYIALVIPYIIVLFVIGTVTEKKIGYFVYQSTTSGINLLMTSHDKAKGNLYIFDEDDINFFIENSNSVTFAEKDSTWKARSLKWIKEHPVRYIGLFFIKIPILYVHDAWGNMSHFNEKVVIAKYVQGDTSLKNAVIKKLLISIAQSMTYYLMLLVFFYALWINRKEILSVKSIFLVILISGTIITCIFPTGPRYHYPFLFPVIIYAAWGIDTLIEKLTKKKQE
jgi:4-amino-4-deoxy-L-arabinose transferase-like glycosyltransferase